MFSDYLFYFAISQLTVQKFFFAFLFAKFCCKLYFVIFQNTGSNFEKIALSKSFSLRFPRMLIYLGVMAQ